MFTETDCSKYFITSISYIQSYDVLLFSLSKLSQLKDDESQVAWQQQQQQTIDDVTTIFIQFYLSEQRCVIQAPIPLKIFFFHG